MRIYEKKINFLVIILFLHLKRVLSNVDRKESQLWIIAKLKNIEWRRSCLSSERCAEPRFQLITSLLNELELHRIDSPVNVESVLLREIVLNVFFENAHPENVLLKGHVVGLDPLYKIPSECDKSKEILVFKKSNYQNITSNQSSVTVELQGRCFTAFVDITKYQNICPWCIDTSIKIHEKTDFFKNGTSILSLDNIPIATEAFIFLGIAIFIITTGCSICLISIIIYNQKHNSKSESTSLFNNQKSVCTLIDTLPSQPTRYTNSSQTNNTLTRKKMEIPIESTYETIDGCGGVYRVESNRNDDFVQYWMTNNVNKTLYPSSLKLELSKKLDSTGTITSFLDGKKINNSLPISEINNAFI
uniref:Recep_L_domain domain-containing protein n=1 Tax=Parastrongyloides trichosuri TaxID=131310 RepID=A0A0N4ZHI8_PARTI